jgi:hypothetical protein
MARLKEPDESIEMVECAECGSEFDVDSAYGSIADDYFCDKRCACDWVSDRMDEFIDMIVE